MKRKFLYLYILLFTISLNCNRENQNNVEINRYNYLDIIHDFKFIYDFEMILTPNQFEYLNKKIKNIKDSKNITISIITEPKGLKEDYRKSTKNINCIFEKNFNFDKILIIRFSKETKVLSISSSKNLKYVFTDSISNTIAETCLLPNFKNNQYYEGLNIAIDSILTKI